LNASLAFSPAPLRSDYATHKTAAIAKWLGAHRRFHMHLTPTYSSWLNQAERWFALFTDKKLRRGAHTSVIALETVCAIGLTPGTKPRTVCLDKTADEILERLTVYL
jgi:hypothetical protein